MYARIKRSDIARMELFVNDRKLTLDQIIAEKRSTYAINAGLYDTKTFKPDNDLIVDGKTLSTGGSGYGYAFEDDKIAYNYKNNAGYANFIGAYPVLASNGKKGYTSIPVGLEGDGHWTR